MWYTLALFEESELMWAALDIPLGIPAADDPDYMTVTDERLKQYKHGIKLGRMPNAGIPTPARFTEALVLLFFCDVFLVNTFLGLEWHGLTWYMIAALEDKKIFRLDDLHPHVCSWIKLLIEYPLGKEVGNARYQFAAAMCKAGGVPKKSPWYSEPLDPLEWLREKLVIEVEERKKNKEEEEVKSV
ncbi:uncharacterized protein ACLA_075190 [Aspergillus clavatus NRRL 1]|uniref:Uncharacterized protein n=1 Tax=Aspergillus clavatus (strain ATCC 1007 / CBS 513.65 / DSM 816 / NCTC 3887 / NRRL 1 / QM 1276 / 107) TaxID=344612 RepID=A1C7W0_ASPCL|nr:uncharacterized protein ACLA_075190 [Aspergillus clavatus NRRL 1]EAW14481.1 conserved hypothetical protein [Aspergillus clavatus NRRL 1]